MNQFFSITLIQDVSNFGDIAQMHESSPNICLICTLNCILVKNNSRIPHIVTGGQGRVIQGNWFDTVFGADYSNLTFYLNLDAVSVKFESVSFGARFTFLVATLLSMVKNHLLRTVTLVFQHFVAGLSIGGS